MVYENIPIKERIRRDLEETEGHRELVKAGFLEKRMAKNVSPLELHVNPDDEFSMPQIGPNDSIISNYSSIARRNASTGMPVYPEAIVACKMREGGYMMMNGHHRWAGAIVACMKTVRVTLIDPS